MTGVLAAIETATWLESAGSLLAILTPLVAVPLTVITFYLRSLREHQVSWHADLIRRVESQERSSVELRKALTDFERDYTSKEEWLRECMLARRTLEQLKESAVRLETLQSRRAGRVRHGSAIWARGRRRRSTSTAPMERDEGI